jgi:hypothetical protein
MNVIFGKEYAELLRERYTILELVNLKDTGSDYQCFCLVDGNSVPAQELPMLEHYVTLHGKLIDNIRKNNKSVITELIRTLHKRWGGELDSFYEAVIDHYK